MTSEPKRIALTIDGKEVSVPEGTTVLMAAREAGIEIPTFCHHDTLADFGACRICMVEVRKGSGSPRTVASCLYPVEEGLIVETETQDIIRHRRTVLELMQARWPALPKALLERYEVPKGRLEEKATFCIMCGLCVRHCTEHRGSGVLGFVGRGAHRQVVAHTSLARAHCPDCAAKGMECLDICPTGVIVNDQSVPSPDSRQDKAAARPVRMRDADNEKAVRTLLGD